MTWSDLVARLLRRRVPLVVTTAIMLVAVASIAAALVPNGTAATLRVERRDLPFTVRTEGELQAVDTIPIGPPQFERGWNFKISMLATDGQEVEAGQPVVAFDTSELQQQLRDERARADSADKELEKLVTDLDLERRRLELELEEARARLRQAELKTAVEAETIAAIDLEKARLDYRLAQTEIDGLEAQLEAHRLREHAEVRASRGKVEAARRRVAQLESNIASMTVTAPQDGTVVLKKDRRGNKKAVGDDIWRAEQILEIPDLSTMEGSATVDEQAAGRLAIGQRVEITLDAHPDRRYTGRIETIGRAVRPKAPRSAENVVEVVVEFDKTDRERMRPGMRLRGSVTIDTIRDALVVPLAAVATDDRGEPYVEVARLMGTSKVYPELGSSTAEYTEVVDGLDEGDRLLDQGERP